MVGKRVCPFRPFSSIFVHFLHFMRLLLMAAAKPMRLRTSARVEDAAHHTTAGG
jgi:hypothetical protein